MVRKPRVTAAEGTRGATEPVADKTDAQHTTPSVEVVVEFDHGGTKAKSEEAADEALEALDKVVVRVTAQIEETRQ